jgi:hypothetical protein
MIVGEIVHLLGVQLAWGGYGEAFKLEDECGEFSEVLSRNFSEEFIQLNQTSK